MEEVVAAFKHVFGLLGASREQIQEMVQNLRRRLEDKEGRSKELERVQEELGRFHDNRNFVKYVNAECEHCGKALEVEVEVDLDEFLQ
jgi:hypothetical protein